MSHRIVGASTSRELTKKEEINQRDHGGDSVTVIRQIADLPSTGKSAIKVVKFHVNNILTEVFINARYGQSKWQNQLKTRIMHLKPTKNDTFSGSS